MRLRPRSGLRGSGSNAGDVAGTVGVEMACESAYKRRNCRKYGRGEDIMGIFHKGLRVCAILLVGVLWSASSQASWLNVFRGLSRMSDDSAKVGWSLAESEFQKEASIRLSTHRASQVWPKATPFEDYFSPGYEGYYDSADWSWKQENHKAGDDWQEETDRLFRELEKDTAKELGKEVVRCLGEHWRREHPFDEHFVPNAIQNCDDKEVWSKRDLVRNGSFDFQDLISGRNGQKAAASFCSHHHPGLRNSPLDRSPSDRVIYRGWAADSTPELEALLARREQLSCSSRHDWNSCEHCLEKDVGDEQVPLRLLELETVLAEAE